jgi:hypothetical protein
MNPQQQAQMLRLRCEVVSLKAALREVIFQCEDADDGLEKEALIEIDRVARNALVDIYLPKGDADG